MVVIATTSPPCLILLLLQCDDDDDDVEAGTLLRDRDVVGHRQLLLMLLCSCVLGATPPFNY